MQGPYTLTIGKFDGGTLRPVADYDLSPDLTDLRFGTGPGGFVGLSAGIETPGRPFFGFLPRGMTVPEYAHVAVWLGAVELWEGRVMQLRGPDGHLTGFEATGYGVTALNDDWYANPALATGSAGVVLADVIGTAAPLLGIAGDPDLFVDSGIQYAFNHFDGRSPKEVVDELAQAGGSPSGASAGNVPYDAAVYENRTLTLIPRTAPPRYGIGTPGGAIGARYWIDYDEDVLDWTRDGTDAVSGVTLTYSGGTAPRTTEQISTTFADTYGLTRRVNLSGGSFTGSPGDIDRQAEQVAKTELARREQWLVSCTLRRGPGRGLRMVPGGEMPSYLVRFGDWVQVADAEPLFILTTQFDCNTGEWRATCANYPRALWSRLAALEEATRRATAGLSPLTGASQDTSLGLTTRYVAGPSAPALMPGTGGLVATDAGVYVNAGGSTQRLGPFRYQAGTGAPSGTVPGDVVVRDDGIWSDAGGVLKLSASV